MQYKKMDRKKRVYGDMLDDRREAPKKYRGTRYTIFSFMAVAGCLAIMKAINPDIPLRSPVMMTAAVAMACVIMLIVGRRGK